MGYKLDLHTHSSGSADGGLTLRDYRYFLSNGLLDYIAITDHDRIDEAQRLQAQLGDLGERIIIGQEITTSGGELIGLYLTQPVAPGLTPAQAIAAIRQQGGLVYVPHPFETVRSGLSAASLQPVAHRVDIVETTNGRAVFQNRGRQARRWAAVHSLATAASSDAHGRFGWGRTYSYVDQPPTRQNLVSQLQSAVYATRKVGGGVLYPKFNRMRRRLAYGTA